MTGANDLNWLGDMPIEVEVAAECPALRMSEILALREGSVIATKLRAGENIGVFAGNARIGAGEFSSTGRGAAIQIVRLGGGK